MVRSPKNARPSRVSAPISFANENSDDDDESNFDLFNQKPKTARKQPPPPEPEVTQMDDSDSDGVQKFFQEYKKQQAKKLSARSAALENHKKALYVSGRKLAEELSKNGIATLEGLKSNIFALRQRELSYEDVSKDLDDMEARAASYECVQAVLQIYPPLIEDLFQRRAESIEAASAMIQGNQARRKQALEQFLRNAHAQVEQSRNNERLATDATNLIRHYKSLLLG
ncbi:hypothetical protein BDZ89DRAFT_1139364 [Hymenopellis radicata]|nr:hypothetical protein BDZ89DRAFT_1139364 [Hymenopellis radicata]